jgi:hypothetical protein
MVKGVNMLMSMFNVPMSTFNVLTEYLDEYI